MILNLIGIVLLLNVADYTLLTTMPTYFTQQLSYPYNVSTSLFGGTAGLVIESLIAATGNASIPAFYLIGAGVIGLVPILIIPEPARVPIREVRRFRIGAPHPAPTA
jgi:MHS family proline/betaine transporter-like MFS transporter